MADLVLHANDIENPLGPQSGSGDASENEENESMA